MKRFEFKLESLLNYRKYLERLAQQHTAKAHLDVTNCEKQITHLELIHDQSADKIEAIVDRGVKSSEFIKHHHYRKAVETGIKDEKLRKLELRKVLKKQMLELKKKSVEKKVMELYREKLKIRHDQEIIKNEQKELDEISSIKTARTLSNETI